MSRDYTKLRVFVLADVLVVDAYKVTRALPAAETFGLRAQLRRAAVSVPTNIVEGSVCRTEKAFLRYLATALGSASEVRYLLRLAVRLRMLDDCECRPLDDRYTTVIKQLESLIAKVTATVKTPSPRRESASL